MSESDILEHFQRRLRRSEELYAEYLARRNRRDDDPSPDDDPPPNDG